MVTLTIAAISIASSERISIRRSSLSSTVPFRDVSCAQCSAAAGDVHCIGRRVP
jgi:hypothetical protein